MMKRRGFLKGLFGAALVPIVGKGDGVSLMSIPHPHLPAGNACVEDMASNVGFGLAPVRAEGAVVPFDPLPDRSFSGTYQMDHPIISPRCDCEDGPHGTACSNRNVLRRM